MSRQFSMSSLTCAEYAIARHSQFEKNGCGIVVDPTAADLDRAVRYLLEHRHRWQAMGRRGREYALENLNWNRLAKRTLTQYLQRLN